MRLSVFVGVLAIGGGIAMGKLLHDREVAQIAATASPDPNRPTPAPGKTTPPGPVTVASPGTPTRTPANGKLTAQELLVLEGPKKLLSQGRFDEARLATFANDPNASPSLKAALTVLQERAKLFGSLTSAIHRHPFANAPDLVEVTLPNDVTYTARVLNENDEMLSLSLADGRQIDVHQERVIKRVRLSADAWMARKKTDLEKEIADLADAGSLEIFHVAFEAFEAGFSDLGVPQLERSLALAGGGAVVDVYGTGDIELLHRAQERLRADKGYPSGGGDSELAMGHRARTPRIASTPTTPDATPTSPTNPTPTNPVASPEPEPEVEKPLSQSDIDRLTHDPSWIKANSTYSKAVAIYRESFAGNTPEQKAGIVQAATLLLEAHDLLDKLPQDMGDANSTIDTFAAKVNSLLRDVKKRKMATGS